MKTATQNLELDHEHILQLIDVMDKMISQKTTSIDDIETVISLIRNFADGFHHAKEENLLFPAMVKNGFSKEQGPIAVMLHDHANGREYVQGMMAGVQLYQNGSINALEKVYENMKDYSLLLKNHIMKENNILFRMADKALSADDQAYLLTEFGKIENNAPFGSKISEYIKSINRLKTLYNNN